MMRIKPVILVFVVTSLCLAGCDQVSVKERRTEFLLDTAVTIAAYGPQAKEAVAAALAEMNRVADLLDANNPDSEVSLINRNAGRKPVPVSAEVFELVELCQHYSQMSSGAFDITVRPLVELWGIGNKDEYVPGPEEIDRALELVDYRQIILDQQKKTVYLPRAGMGIDLGGVGKGYAADRAREMLLEHGISSALIDAGGNIWALGERPDGKPWRIGIRHPRPKADRNVVAVLSGRDFTIVTSGDYERFFQRNNIRYHHIFNPATGLPARGLISATVVGPNSAEADILSTAVFVLGADQGLALVRQLPQITAMVVTPDLDVLLAGPLQSYFEFTGKEGVGR